MENSADVQRLKNLAKRVTLEPAAFLVIIGWNLIGKRRLLLRV